MSAHDIETDSPHFSLAAYERAVETRSDLSIAVRELDKCVNNPTELARVYNGNGVDVNRTALFVTLQSSSQQGSTDTATKKLLEHSVMREVIALKWQRFGLRMYMEQLLMYCLLLLSMTVAVSMRPGVDAYPTQLQAWLYVGIPLLIALSASPWFTYERRASWRAATAGIICIALAVMLSMRESLHVLHWTLFTNFNTVVVGLTGLYFLRFELNEMFGEVAEHNRLFDCGFHSLSPRSQKVLYYVIFCPFSVVYQFAVLLVGGDTAKYFDSFFNCVQLPTFSSVLVFAVYELVGDIDPTLRLYGGMVLNMLLWILGLQYLEVHGTAGYLIPMMRGLLRDVFRFLAFYWPFQCAYACGYFLLFQDTDEETYNTLWRAFVTTFLVMLGQIELDPFENLPDTSSYVLGYTLLLSHATIVMVMLLNVLIAIMTKTVDGGLELAKLEALVSFAECVLRSEKTAGLTPIAADGPGDHMALLSATGDIGFISDDLGSPSSSERLDQIEQTLAEVLALLKDMKRRPSVF
ncbi:hypothetical protein SPRG_11343 [Saprolegnia parasitica CBS 223.65]|uniref:Ion transport domain-containing protein n=1 Tax=Saprolegnia parasitica (strain CBS 223.65) TaxID=695850 RepID=A0A067C767_SAPPC|nr:hypothetical protein SPRG_11343 [Saprolegnia parasitica CBS 223.65]KDO22391.1 hypothetical protein SPRG_11343 [Saprolegnia parasitica CBS 223.65]|eukprot:XP_012206914.1 hypothetical protein SPRG_11343 [Saprolegnia parasitica CBS 223.65]